MMSDSNSPSDYLRAIGDPAMKAGNGRPNVPLQMNLNKKKQNQTEKKENEQRSKN